MKKYFNPLKPDSARVVYQILPMQYGDPDTIPNPLKMEVEIRDKDSVLVYGPRNLTAQEQKDQVLFWDGRDNYGQVVDMEQGPFSAILGLQYAETGKDRMAPWIRKKAAGILPNMIFVEKIVAFDDIELKDYPDGSIYVAHWTPDEIKIDTCQPAGDVIEIYQEGSEYKKKLEFKLGFNLQARVDPERVNATLYVKCKMKTDRLGEKNVEWEGLENQIEFKKDFGGIPAVADFGRQNMVFELEYRYKWPDNTNLLISTEEIPETLMVFFQKNDLTKPDHPFWGYATYWNDYFGKPNPAKPNWWQYWREIDFLNDEPYEVGKGRYTQSAEYSNLNGYYKPSIDDQYYNICRHGGDSCRYVSDTLQEDPVFDTLYGFHTFVLTTRHENLHRTYYLDWWGSYSNWKQDSAKPIEERKDRDHDWIPDSVELEVGLNPDVMVSHTAGAWTNLWDFEWLVQRFEKVWVDSILDPNYTDIYIRRDWACPGKQTAPEF